MEEKPKTLVISLIVLLLAAAFTVGTVLGQKIGRAKENQKLSPLITAAFGKPPEDLRNMSGKIKSVGTQSFTIEIRDPNDYLPHVDGTPPKMQTRTVMVQATTKYLLIDYSNPRLAPQVKQISFSSLKQEDTVTVKSNLNIKDALEFEAYEVDLTRY